MGVKAAMPRSHRLLVSPRPSAKKENDAAPGNSPIPTQRPVMASAGKTLIGIVANPASGRDIRRLTAKASVFPTAEKANMVLRLLGAFGAAGVSRVLMMPDLNGIAAGVKRGLDTHRADAGMPWPPLEFLDMEISESAHDTAHAVRAMCRAGARVIVVLGGDGTHRIAAAHCGEVPIATLSSGTNNAFPELREATTTGLAAALVALERVPLEAATRRNKMLIVESVDRREAALVDVCVTAHEHVGSRALWRAGDLRELYVAFGEPDAIGLSSIAGLLQPVGRDDPFGLRLFFAHGTEAAGLTRITAPIAPGLLATLAIAGSERMQARRSYPIRAERGTVAVDGEREFEFDPGHRLSVRLELQGPLTVDVARTLRYAAEHGILRA